MAAVKPSPAAEVDEVWRRQSVWSQTANRLKAQIGRARAEALCLTIAAAVLALAGSQVATLNSAAGRTLAFLAAAAAGLIPVVGRGASAEQVSDWVHARSVSETLKSETYLYLVGAGRYTAPDRDQQLLAEADRLEHDAVPLLPHTVGLQPVERPLPAVHDVPSYLGHRVTSQIADYYQPQAARLQHRHRLLQRAEAALAATAAILAAAAGAFDVPALAAWVSVVTTVAAAITAHVAAQRYQYLTIEYLRTAAELQRLRDHRTAPDGTPLTDDQLVGQCEQVISVQNDQWMARWGSDTTAP